MGMHPVIVVQLRAHRMTMTFSMSMKNPDRMETGRRIHLATATVLIPLPQKRRRAVRAAGNGKGNPLSNRRIPIRRSSPPVVITRWIPIMGKTGVGVTRLTPIKVAGVSPELSQTLHGGAWRYQLLRVSIDRKVWSPGRYSTGGPYLYYNSRFSNLDKLFSIIHSPQPGYARSSTAWLYA